MPTQQTMAAADAGCRAILRLLADGRVRTTKEIMDALPAKHRPKSWGSIMARLGKLHGEGWIDVRSVNRIKIWSATDDGIRAAKGCEE